MADSISGFEISAEEKKGILADNAAGLRGLSA